MNSGGIVLERIAISPSFIRYSGASIRSTVHLSSVVAGRASVCALCNSLALKLEIVGISHLALFFARQTCPALPRHPRGVDLIVHAPYGNEQSSSMKGCAQGRSNVYYTRCSLQAARSAGRLSLSTS